MGAGASVGDGVVGVGVDVDVDVVSSDGEEIEVVGSRFCVRNTEPSAFVDWVVRRAFRAVKNCGLVLIR